MKNGTFARDVYIAGENGKDKIMDVYIAGEHPVKNGTFARDVYIAGENGKDKIMDVYIAGERGNDKIMDVYIAGERGNDKIMDNIIKEYLREENCNINIDFSLTIKDMSILESYYYLRSNPNMHILINKFGKFLLDSGAFTFLTNAKEKVDFDTYIEEYAEFINKWNIEHFFELDIDSVVGLSEVERLRKKLEELTNKKCIPVWHKTRGKEYFINMCREYPYVAIGGIVIKEIPIDTYEKIFPWFIKTAHENNAKIHALGYTRIKNLKKYHFDSVDSTAWLVGNRGGFLYRFNPLTGLMDKIIPKDKTLGRMKSRATALHNFNEWIKFQKYALLNL